MDGRGQQKPAGKGNQANNKIRTAPVSEAQQSLNSLAQVAAFCDVQQAVTSEAGPSGPKRKKAKLGHSKDLTTLAHKTVSSLDPSLKQAFCQTCGTALIPGLTSRTRIRASGPHQRAVSTTCLSCEGRVKIPAPPKELQNKSGLAAQRRLRKQRKKEERMRVRQEKPKAVEIGKSLKSSCTTTASAGAETAGSANASASTSNAKQP
ncbi:hypothetical protein OC846_005694 [Tilletia horrida]|uniref:Rpr2-domain-containing protein n=1 Tax=Tilletia horrida TaxID=155126 RepID=A0AAN6GKU9_9BASI|nr:hypothetical protein OC846_005694 [Tilletia horrida]